MLQQHDLQICLIVGGDVNLLVDSKIVLDAVNVVIDSEPTETNSQLLRYKTTNRDIYNNSKSRSSKWSS